MPLLKYTQVVGGVIVGPAGYTSCLRYGGWWQSGQNNQISDAIAQGCHGQVFSLTAAAGQTGFNQGLAVLDIPIISAARFTFRAASGNAMSIVFPMPDPSIYLSDGETVDPTASLAANLIAVVLSYGTTPAGETLVSYDSGRRIVVPHQPIQLG